MVLFTPGAGKAPAEAPGSLGQLVHKILKKMTQLIVLSAIGTDRPGVVNDLSKVILDCGGNIEESRMTALGTEFAMLLLVSGNWHTLGKLEASLDKLSKERDLTVTIKKTKTREHSEKSMPYAVDVVALDQPGIVFQLAHFFASRDIEIADMATRSYAAAHSGSPMFAVQMNVNVPASVHLSQLREEFLEMCDQLNLDGLIEPVKT